MPHFLAASTDLCQQGPLLRQIERSRLGSGCFRGFLDPLAAVLVYAAADLSLGIQSMQSQRPAPSPALSLALAPGRVDSQERGPSCSSGESEEISGTCWLRPSPSSLLLRLQVGHFYREFDLDPSQRAFSVGLALRMTASNIKIE